MPQDQAESINDLFQVLDEVILKAREKGAKIDSWSQSPNGKTIVNFRDKLPVFFMNTAAAVDSLIHQYNLVSLYTHLYQHKSVKITSVETDNLTDKKTALHKNMELDIIQQCDKIFSNMNNELISSTQKKVYALLHKYTSTYFLSQHQFYKFQDVLIEHYQKKLPTTLTSQTKKQLQIFISFFEKITYKNSKNASINEYY